MWDFIEDDMQSLLAKLNPQQLEAVTTTEGPVLVIAGAGSGKTRVLTYRIAYLIGVKQVPPFRIMAVTFTNKAADEMKERIAKLVGKSVESMWIGTFHSICVRILRFHAKLLGYSSNFSIYDRDDQVAVLKSLMVGRWKATPRKMAARISAYKNRRYVPSDEREIELFKAYQDKLKSSNAMDFDDLLLNTIKLFEEHPKVKNIYAERFKYIHVDEYQDTNRAQYELLKHLASKHGNLFVVGDEDQSIYRFRGAELRNILDFEKDFPNATVIRLEQNYRSTKRILNVATTLVAHNRLRKGKRLWTENPLGEKIKIIECMDEESEAARIAEIIERSGRPYSDFLVLYRINALSRAIEMQLRIRGIPYKVIGAVKFFERKEIKDIISYLRLLVNPEDDVAFARIVNVPPRGIGKMTMKEIENLAKDQGISLHNSMKLLLKAEELGQRQHKALSSFEKLIKRFRRMAKSEDVHTLTEKLIDEIGYYEYLRQSSKSDEEAEQRIDNLKELLGSMYEFVHSAEEPTLENYLSMVSLRTEADEVELGSGRVSLMTVHTAKGLEFPVVIVAGLADSIFPHFRSYGDDEAYEEERRLLHVAITRAKEEVFLLFSRTSFIRDSYLEPSPFLSELPQEDVEWVGGTSYQEIPSFDSEYFVERQPSSVNGFKVGDRVFSQYFGEGEILKIDPEGKATIRFKVGTKVIVLKYAKLSKL